VGVGALTKDDGLRRGLRSLESGGGGEIGPGHPWRHRREAPPPPPYRKANHAFLVVTRRAPRPAGRPRREGNHPSRRGGCPAPLATHTALTVHCNKKPPRRQPGRTGNETVWWRGGWRCSQRHMFKGRPPLPYLKPIHAFRWLPAGYPDLRGGFRGRLPTPPGRECCRPSLHVHRAHPSLYCRSYAVEVDLGA